MSFIRFALITAGGFLTLITIFMSMVSNFNLGLILSCGAGFVLLIYGIWLKQINKLAQTGILKAIRYAGYACAAFLCILISFLYIYGKTDTVNYTEDAIIVLGAAVRGKHVSLPLAHRLEKAVEYSKINKNCIIVVSGGQGPQEDIPEAEAMAQYLISRGVDESRIIKEDKSTSTYENFLYSKKLLDEIFRREYNAAFITNDFHTYRAGCISRQASIPSARLGAKTDWYTAPVNYLRECLAVLKVWVFKV